MSRAGREARAPQPRSWGERAVAVGLVAGVGLSAGCLARLALEISCSWLVDLTQCLGFWTITASCLAVMSPSPRAAGGHVLAYLTAMNFAYYFFQLQWDGYFGLDAFGEWTVVAMIAAAFAAVIWYGWGYGRWAAFCASLPLLILGLEGATLIGEGMWATDKLVILFDFLAAALWLLLFPAGWRQRGRAALYAAGELAIVLWIALWL